MGWRTAAVAMVFSVEQADHSTPHYCPSLRLTSLPSCPTTLTNRFRAIREPMSRQFLLDRGIGASSPQSRIVAVGIWLVITASTKELGSFLHSAQIQ
jgi:hypothetical protein